jgi:SAM-dependent methyltransferase
MSSAEPSPPAPDPFGDTFVTPIAARAVVAAISLGVFDSLAQEPAEPGALAARLGLDPVGVEPLATALIALGYLEHDPAGALRVSQAAAPLVVRGSQRSIATFAGDFARHHWDAMGSLEGALRGEPPTWHDRGPDDPIWPAYIRGLFELSRDEQDANAALVPVADPVALLDLAGGHGGFAMAMCRRHPALRATVVELPGAAAVGREIVAEEGFADRVSFQEGDLFEVDLGSGYDVVSTFNLLHHLPPEQVLELFRRARSSLRPGGCLIVGDTDRPAPDEPVSQVGALTGLAFYVESRSRTYSLEEIEGALAEAGLGSVRVHRNERSPWRIVIAASAPE